MSHEWNCRCARCWIEIKNEMAVNCGPDLDPPTRQEEAYDEANCQSEQREWEAA